MALISNIHICYFLPPKKIDAPGIGRVPRCIGLHGLHGALGFLSPPPLCANPKLTLQGTPPAYLAIREPTANLGAECKSKKKSNFRPCG